MCHPTFLAQKVRIQLARIQIIVCEANAGTVEVLCKNNTPLLHCCWQWVFEPRNEPQITFAPKILHCCHVLSHMRRRYSRRLSPRFRSTKEAQATPQMLMTSSTICIIFHLTNGRHKARVSVISEFFVLHNRFGGFKELVNVQTREISAFKGNSQ